MGNKNGKPFLRDEDVKRLSSTSGMSEDEAKEAFNNFVDQHPDGKLNKKSFQKMLAMVRNQK